jgi:Lrp/AsnC family transcriptional regulator
MQDLDALDMKILRAIQQDGDASTAEIAERVNLSQSACWRRMARLRESGVIRRRSYVLDRRALGFGVVAFVRVKLGEYETDALERFERAAAAVPHIQELQLISAENAYRLRVVARSMEDYERLFRHAISRLPGVKDVQASLVVSEVKYSTDLPLED